MSSGESITQFLILHNQTKSIDAFNVTDILVGTGLSLTDLGEGYARIDAAGGSQTPWTSDIDGAGHNLTTTGIITAGAGYVVNPTATEIIQNGYFTAVTGWSFNASIWNLSGGFAHKYSTNAGNLQQTWANLLNFPTLGKLYRISFDISNVISGTGFTITIGGQGIYSSEPLVAGHYEKDFMWTGASGFTLLSIGGAKYDIDNISIKDIVLTTAFVSNGSLDLYESMNGSSSKVYQDGASQDLLITNAGTPILEIGPQASYLYNSCMGIDGYGLYIPNPPGATSGVYFGTNGNNTFPALASVGTAGDWFSGTQPGDFAVRSNAFYNLFIGTPDSPSYYAGIEITGVDIGHGAGQRVLINGATDNGASALQVNGASGGDAITSTAGGGGFSSAGIFNDRSGLYYTQLGYSSGIGNGFGGLFATTGVSVYLATNDYVSPPYAINANGTSLFGPTTGGSRYAYIADNTSVNPFSIPVAGYFDGGDGLAMFSYSSAAAYFASHTSSNAVTLASYTYAINATGDVQVAGNGTFLTYGGKWPISITNQRFTGTPSIGFNALYSVANSRWEYGTGSVGNFASMVQNDPVNGGLSYLVSTGAGNDGDPVNWKYGYYLTGDGRLIVGNTSDTGDNLVLKGSMSINNASYNYDPGGLRIGSTGPNTNERLTVSSYGSGDPMAYFGNATQFITLGGTYAIDVTGEIYTDYGIYVYGGGGANQTWITGGYSGYGIWSTGGGFNVGIVDNYIAAITTNGPSSEMVNLCYSGYAVVYAQDTSSHAFLCNYSGLAADFYGGILWGNYPTSPGSTGQLFVTDAATAVANNYNVVCMS